VARNMTVEPGGAQRSDDKESGGGYGRVGVDDGRGWARGDVRRPRADMDQSRVVEQKSRGQAKGCKGTRWQRMSARA